MSNINVPLLRKAVEWAEAEAAKPEELCRWLQRLYICPSPEDLDRMTDEQVAELGGRDRATTTLSYSKDASCGTCFCIAGWVAYELEGNMNYDDAYDIARDALGLNEYQATTLFQPFNSIERVREIAESFAGEAL